MSVAIAPPPLTHRFTVLYADGSTFEQPLTDQPQQPRPDGRGSAYDDVDQARVVACFLESGADGDPAKHLYQVSLRDGGFVIDGGPAFKLGPETEIPPGARRALVYFRRVAHQQETAVATGALLGRAIRRSYHLGYRVVDADGRELQAARTIEVGREVFRG